MMKKWRLLGIDKFLKKALKDGKTLCGASAGSICWFKYGISDSLQFYDDNSHELIRVKGMGILPFTHNPHFGSKTEDKGYRTAAMKKIMKRTPGVCIAVPDACAVIFDGEKYEVISKNKKIKASVAYWKDGEYYLDAINMVGSMNDLLMASR